MICRRMAIIAGLVTILINSGCDFLTRLSPFQASEPIDPDGSSDVRHYAENNPVPDPTAQRRSPLSEDSRDAP
jgi:hypothetical protein